VSLRVLLPVETTTSNHNKQLKKEKKRKFLFLLVHQSRSFLVKSLIINQEGVFERNAVEEGGGGNDLSLRNEETQGKPLKHHGTWLTKECSLGCPTTSVMVGLAVIYHEPPPQALLDPSEAQRTTSQLNGLTVGSSK